MTGYISNMVVLYVCVCVCCFVFFQAEDGIRDLVRSRGLGDVYKRQQDGLLGLGHPAEVAGEGAVVVELRGQGLVLRGG